MMYPGENPLFKAGGTRPVRPEDGEWECFDDSSVPGIVPPVGAAERSMEGFRRD